MRAPFLRLVLGLLLVLPLAAPTRADEPLTPAQKAAVEKIIHDYFMAHPDFMVEVLHAAEEKLKAEQANDAKQAIAAKRDELLHDASAPVGGNPKGDVTIVEFFDYRCPYCKEVEPSLDALLQQDPKLRIVYKEFPVLGPASVYASRIALAARQQGKYAAFHKAMMGTKGEVTDDVVLKVATSVGIDVEKAKADMNAPEIDDLIKRNYALADALDIQGTPAFVIGDTLIPGATDIAKLRALIAEQRKSG
ncbi:MAG TPA: DsbA family protein [Stellaceae bacterium]|nr:DsbA family protein [Stellaceae bacterium]